MDDIFAPSHILTVVYKTKDPNFYAFQTDSIEGWVHSATHSSMNVTVTSAYSTILKRHIAVLISIMFGRSGDHYAAHFCTLLEGIGYKEYNEFESKFPGNICDFSLGEKAGWEKAVRSTFKIDADVEIQLENSYKCCAVHFQRSVTRVKSSHSLVPRHKLEDFEHKINILLCKDSNRTDAERFYKTVEEIRKDFPLLKDWINWYVTNNIEKCFFSAVSNGSIKGFGKDTNAQEGTGRWLKKSDPSKKPSICSCIKYLYLRGRLIQQDTEAEKEGRQSRYRRGGALNPIDRDADSEAKNKRSQQRARSRKRAYENDGRAPDTEALLTPPKKRAKIGRRPGSTNKAPRGNDIVDRSFGIPWSYKNNGAVVSNTCSMDSVLMLLYMLRKFSSLPQEIFAYDEVLTKVLNQIEIGQFDAARIYWISELTAKFGDSVFNSMIDLDCDASVHSAASSLFQMGVLTEYDECQFIQENCPHYCDYINVPGIRGSGMTTESFLYLGNGNTYGSLQQYFDCQHNGFGMLSSRSKSNKDNVKPRLIATEPCGTNIVLEGRKPGCTGKRMKRKVIQHLPGILEVVIPKTTDGNHPVTKPSHIEHSLTINEQKYQFVGAVLYGGNGRSGHYQSLFFIGGKFATYDGMKAKNKIVWIKEDEHFRAAFHAAKLWYVPFTDFDGVEVHAGVGVPIFDFKIGVPYGLSFGLKRNIGKVEDDHCDECNEFLTPYNPCLMARDKMGDGEAQVIQYFHLHCCSQRFKSRASEVFDAVDVCSFPNSAKVELRKMLVGDFHASNQVSSIDVEGILRAGMERNQNQIGVGQQWFNSLPPGEQRVVKEGVDAVMYGGCMVAAMKAFDNVVRENARDENIQAPNPDVNAREENIRAPTPDGDKKPAALDNAVRENANAREENIRAPTPEGDKKPAATQKHNLEVEDNNNEEKGVEIAREERKEIGIGTSSSSSSSSSSDCSKTLSELYAEWELDVGGNFPVLTIEAGDSITHWNNATVGDRFHQRTVIVTTVKDNHDKLYCPLVVDNGDWIHKEQMVRVERHSIRAPLRNFTLVPSGDQLASSTKIGSERISGILMKHAENLLGEGNSLEKDCLQLPTPTENSRKKTKGKEMNNVGSTRERCETEAKECKRSKNKMCIRKMCASCCKLAGEGGEKCRLKNHQS